MRARGLLLAGSLSFLPFALALASAGKLRIEGASWTGLALGPWLALAGLPREPLGAARPARWTWLLPVALALPSVALAVGLDAGDAQAGRLGGPGLLGGLGLVLVGLWSLAAGVARTPGAASTYGVLWLALVPGAAALLWALVWAPASSGPGLDAGWLDSLARGLPLPWLGRCMDRGPGGPPGAGAPGVPLLLGWLANVGVVLAVGGIVRGLDRRLDRRGSSAARERA